MDVSVASRTTALGPEHLDQVYYSEKASLLPEKQLVNFLSEQQQQFSAHLTGATAVLTNPPAQALLNPKEMLATQYGIMQAMLSVDLAAKFVGGMAQAVNRLVTIQ